MYNDGDLKKIFFFSFVSPLRCYSGVCTNCKTAILVFSKLYIVIIYQYI